MNQNQYQNTFHLIVNVDLMVKIDFKEKIMYMKS